MSINLKAAVSALCLTTALTCGVFAQTDKPTYFTSDGSQAAAKVVYEYKPDSLFQVNVQQGFVSDIAFKQGETITYIGAGDTKRWLIDQATVAGQDHLYIKPLAPGIQTNMIVNTTERSYRLYLVSVSQNYTPIVQFSFPDDTSFHDLVKAPLPWKNKEEKDYYDIFMEKRDGAYVPKKTNNHYAVKKHGNVAPDMYPTAIFDDGTRTYIQMNPNNKYDMPVLYNLDEDKKIDLVNYRFKGDYLVADRVFTRARLFYSNKTWIDIVASKTPYTGGERD